MDQTQICLQGFEDAKKCFKVFFNGLQAKLDFGAKQFREILIIGHSVKFAYCLSTQSNPNLFLLVVIAYFWQTELVIGYSLVSFNVSMN
jgi:hypothetical protein